jgi:hypothetical protein
MKYSTIKVGALGLMVVALLAVAVPALAGVRPDDRAGFHGAVVTSPSTSVRPDDRAGSRGISLETHRVASGGRDFVPGKESGFDWAAAGAGAGTATAAALLVAWALTLRRNHRRAEAPA